MIDERDERSGFKHEKGVKAVAFRTIDKTTADKMTAKVPGKNSSVKN